jgi:hypothetical protein
MKKKSPKPLGKPTLHDFELVPITDPAEQAALERRCKEAEKRLATATRPSSTKPKSSRRK